MSAEPLLFRVNTESRESERIEEVEFSQLGFQERQHIQEWVATNPGILGEDLLIIGKEFSGFDRTNERLDLLAVDVDGKLVVIELKRDDTGADVHWQAIKYASYLHSASPDNIIRMLADYEKVSESEAENRLLQHLDSDNLDILNNDQHIILASHRFAPEATSAVLWLNEKIPGKDLITCVQLTPYRDAKTGSLYIQASTIIPVPGVEDYVIGVGDSPSKSGPTIRRTRSPRQYKNRDDEITRFLRGVRERAIDGLPDELKPNEKNRWAGKKGRRPKFRYYHTWYSRMPWNWHLFYLVHLYPGEEGNSGVARWTAKVGFGYWNKRGGANLSTSELADLFNRVAELNVYDGQEATDGRDGEITVSRHADMLDESFAKTLADTLRRFIEVVTPEVDDFEATRNEEEA